MHRGVKTVKRAWGPALGFLFALSVADDASGGCAGAQRLGGPMPNVECGEKTVRSGASLASVAPGPDRESATIVCPKDADGPDCDYVGLQRALKSARDGDTLVLRSGIYREAAILRPNGLTLLAQPGAHMSGVAAAGKAALVITGDDTVIEGLECSGIWVPDGNGACIRLEGENLTLRNVHFHDSQQGILGGGGTVLIEDSLFENLGGDLEIAKGRAHAIYVSSGDALIVRNSRILASKDEGHEIKSRARRTVIEGSVVASLEGVDSRLVDVSNGGELVIRDSLLQEGPNSRNSDLVGFALEGQKYATNSVLIESSTIVSDRPGSRLYRGAVRPVLRGNTLIAVEWPGENKYYRDRASAGWPAYPDFPLD